MLTFVTLKWRLLGRILILITPPSPFGYLQAIFSTFWPVASYMSIKFLYRYEPVGVKLKQKCLKITFWSIRGQYRNSHCVRLSDSSLHTFSNSWWFYWGMRMAVGGHIKNSEKRLLFVQVCIVLFFSRTQNILASSLMSNHAMPMGNSHTGVLVTTSAFTYTRKMFTPAVQEITNTYLQQANALVCGRKTSLDSLSWWHIMAIRGKQHTQRTSRNLASRTPENTRKRAAVSLTKARNVFTNRRKKRNPTTPKPAKCTHLDEWTAQLRRETLKYAEGTLFRFIVCSCKVLM
jgi:hypothetical protein